MKRRQLSVAIRMALRDPQNARQLLTHVIAFRSQANYINAQRKALYDAITLDDE